MAERLAAALERRSLFRDVNTRIRDCVESLAAGDADAYELLCECGRPDCRERVRIDRPALDELLASHRYVVASGHETGAADVVAKALAA